MPIEVTCPCGHRFRAEDAFENRDAACPKCRTPLRITGKKVSPFDVFVSYSSKDKAVADAAVATLETRGIRCWIAPRDIVPGKEWSESIIEGINQSRMVVLIFSGNSNASQQVVREVERAVNRAMPIVPFRIENLLPSKAMEYFISSHHWLDAYQPPLDAHLEKLANSCQAFLSGAPLPREAQEPKGLVGKAMRSLLARDHRPRVLAALTLLLVLVGGMIVGSLYYLKEPKASAEVIDAKVAAENQWAETQKAIAGLGLDSESQAVETALKSAQVQFDQKQFDPAASGFQEVAVRAKELQSLGEVKKIRAVFEEETKRIDLGSLEFGGAAAWKESAKLALDAERAKRYADAIRHYQEGQKQFRNHVLPQLHYLSFWAGYAARVIYFGRAAEATMERLQRTGVFVQRAPFPSREEYDRARQVFASECVPQLRIPDAIADQINTEKSAEKLDKAVGSLFKHLEKTISKEEIRWFRMGFQVASITGFLEHHTRIGNEISPFGYLRYDDYGTHPVKMMIFVAETCNRVEMPSEMRKSFEEAAYLYAKTWDQGGELGAFAGARRQYFPCLERYRALPLVLKDSESAVEFFAKATPPTVDFTPEEIAFGNKLYEIDCPTYDSLDDKGERVCWLYLARAKKAIDLPETRKKLMPIVRLDLVHRTQTPITDNTFAQIGEIESLRELSIHSAELTPKSLEPLVPLKNLDTLALCMIRKGATAESLAPIAGMKNLRWLSLSDSPFPDDAFAHLAGLHDLEELHVRGSKLTAQGLNHLKGLTKLKVFTSSLASRELKDFTESMPGLNKKK